MNEYEKQVIENQVVILESLDRIISNLFILPEFNRTGDVKVMRDSQEYKIQCAIENQLQSTDRLLSREER